jgi:hypothetical protein
VAPLDVLIGVFTSRTYAVATLVFRATGLLLHQLPGRYYVRVCLAPELPSDLDQRRHVALARDVGLGRIRRIASLTEPWEGLWANLKGCELANRCCADRQELVATAQVGSVRVRRDPDLLRSFLAGTGLTL